MASYASSHYWLGIAALFGLTGVAASAIGAHAAQGALAHELIMQASCMQLFHAVLLVALHGHHGRWLTYGRWLLAGGMVFFCGSLYAKAFLMLEHAPLAPFGGSCLMLGWLAIAIHGFSKKA
jgi:uncharacterized membrane protein YgdD (TMEM256/DUF423 family)